MFRNKIIDDLSTPYPMNKLLYSHSYTLSSHDLVSDVTFSSFH